jgi:hypothetical protein
MHVGPAPFPPPEVWLAAELRAHGLTRVLSFHDSRAVRSSLHSSSSLASSSASSEPVLWLEGEDAVSAEDWEAQVAELQPLLEQQPQAKSSFLQRLYHDLDIEVSVCDTGATVMHIRWMEPL